MPTFDFAAYRRDVDRKAAAAKPALAALHDDQGKPIFVPEQQSQQVARVLAPLQQAVQEAEELAGRAQDEATRLEAQQHSDPLSGLSTEELTRLAAARELAQAEIAGLTLQELSSRLLSVAASGDKVSQRLHLLFAKPVVAASNDPALHERLAALDNQVYGAERAKVAQALEQAATLRKDAAALNFHARDALAELDGSNAQSLERRRVEYSSIF